MDLNLQPKAEEVLTVSALTARIQSALRSAVGVVWLKGEISSLRRQSSGHCYFCLKDADSQINAVLFRGQAAGLSVDLREGMQVVAYGEVDVYPPRGTYQLIVRHLVEEGEGRLRREFARLKAKLAAEGLFASERKRPIPKAPDTVAVVTSPTGAAIRDFVSILRRLDWRGRVVVLPAKVQGAGAAAEIVEQIERANRMGCFDLLVVGRGGGSLEDLWPFNEEAVARAVAGSKLPVISAVGHEIDTTLSDLAADKRAETPSAAAELIASGQWELRQRLSECAGVLGKRVEARVERLGMRMEILSRRFTAVSPEYKVNQFAQRVDDLAAALEGALRDRIHGNRRRLHELALEYHQLDPRGQLKLCDLKIGQLRKALDRGTVALMQERRKELARMAGRLEGASPENALKRGYVIVRDKEGKVISRASDTQPGQVLVNEFGDGKVEVTRHLMLE